MQHSAKNAIIGRITMSAIKSGAGNMLPGNETLGDSLSVCSGDSWEVEWCDFELCDLERCDFERCDFELCDVDLCDGEWCDGERWDGECEL